MAGVDNDLVAVTGAATLDNGARLELIRLSADAAYRAALTAADNPTPGQLRYTILSTTDGVQGQFAALGLAEVTVEKVREGRDVQLVLSGNGGGGDGGTGIVVNQAPVQLGLVLPQEPMWGCRAGMIGNSTNASQARDETSCVWVNPHVLRGSLDTVSGGDAANPYTITGADYLAGGIALGRDVPLDKDWHVGGAFTYAAIDADLDAGGSQRSSAYHFMAYGAYSRDDWEAAFWGGYTRYIVKSSRGTGLEATPTAKAQFDMHQLRLGGAVRRVLPIDANWTLLPRASLSYEPIRRKAYAETGGGDANFRADAERWDILKSTLGTTLRYTWTDRPEMTAEFDAAWQGLIGPTGMELKGTYEGAPNQTFATGRTPYPHSSLVVSAGFSHRAPDDAIFAIAYTGKFNSAQRESQLDVKFKWKF